MIFSSTLFGDLRVAAALLTRLPLPLEAPLFERHRPRAFWAFPVVGMIVAGLAALVGAGALWAGLPPFAVAGLVIGTQILVTGAMHEDGLADSADGLWGGWTVERRLEIMKDSHIGSYGVLALILSLLLRATALAAVAQAGPSALAFALLASAPISRSACVALMYGLPNARGSGLSASTGRPEAGLAAVALGLGALCCVVYAGFWPLILACGAVAACGAIARAKIGGQTGDILGAAQQVTEITVLLSLAATI